MSGVNNSTWATYGGYLANQKLSAQMRAQALGNYVYRQFVDKKDGLGKGAGDVVTFSKRLRIDTAGAALTETASITQKNIKITKGTASVVEYGNKVLYSLKSDTLAMFNLKSEYGQGLMDDQVYTLDNAIYTVMKTAKFKAVCTNTGKTHINFTTTGTATATSAATRVTMNNIRGVIDLAKTYQIPKMGSNYICIGATNFISDIYDDLLAVAQYAEPEFRYKDEIGKFYGARFVEDNSLADTTAGGSTLGEALLFGEEAVAEAVAMPEELRYYEEEGGRFRYLMWLAIVGYAKIWDRVLDGQTANLSGLERIIHVTSA
jgi:N4-gp56 family major capsid protein